MRKRLICDVNIWYYLGNGLINPDDVKDYRLVGSVLNIIELGSSEKLIDDPESVKQAMLAIDKYACEVIPLESFDHYIKEHIDPNYESPSEANLKKEYHALLSWAKGQSEFELDTVAKKQEFKTKIEVYNQRRNNYIDKVNEALPNIRKDKKKLLKKDSKEYKEEMKYLIDSVTAMVFEIISFRTDKPKKELSIPKNQIEFMIRAWAMLYRNIISIGNGKLQGNDPEDKGYLPYVGKDDLFWSGDKKFLNKIRIQPSDPKLEKFLFDPDRTLISDKTKS